MANPLRRQPAPPRPLTRIRVGGFKSYKDPVEVEIRPLTVLAGANSAGKSTLLQPLLLMKQTLEAPYDPGPLLLDGSLVAVESAATLFWQGKAKSENAREWWVETSGTSHHVRSTFAREGRPPRLILVRTEDLAGGLSLEAEHGAPSPGLREAMRLPPSTLENFELHVRRTRCYYTVFAERDGLSLPLGTPNPNEMLLKLIHLPGLRGNPLRSYRHTAAQGEFPGAFQHYVAGTLLGWKEAKDDRLSGVGEDLRAMGLSWKVDPLQRGDTNIELRIGRTAQPLQGGANDTVNIADVGFGASQVLPVLVGLRAAGPGQVVHIEQPELHLHPRAQIALAGLLTAAVKRGATVITETHSSLLLRALQLEVATGRLPPGNIGLHWFERSADGASTSRPGTIDGSGAYGDWPADFSDLELEIDRRLIDAAFAKALA